MSELAFLSLNYALEHLLASAIIALVVLGLCRVKAIPPEARANILFVALTLTVLGPMLSLPHGGSATDGVSMKPDAAAILPPGTAPDAVALDVASGTAPSGIEIGQPIAMLLVALWCAGAAWQLARHVKGYARLRRVVVASRRSPALENDYRHLLPTGVEIRLSASFGPAVVGALRPKILIPEHLVATLPQEALRAVLLHESSHVRRNDLAALAFQKIAEAVFWWNPLVRWLGTTLCTAREIACDIAASRACESRADYADALLTAVEYLAPSRERRMAPALGVADSLQALDQRIGSLIETRTISSLTARIASLGALLVLAAAWMAAQAASLPVVPSPAHTTASTRQGSTAPAGAGAGTRSSRITVAATTAAAFDPDVEMASDNIDEAPGEAAEPGGEASAPDRTSSIEPAAEHDAAWRSADEEYRRAAWEADRDYTLAAQVAGETYRRRFAALEGVTPSSVFETRLSGVRRDYDQTLSAAVAKYEKDMAQAAARFDTATQARYDQHQARYRH